MFLKRLFTVFIITTVIAYLMGMLFDGLYKKRWVNFFFNKTDELVEGKINYDVILLGNSTVHFGINPYYFDSITKFKSYNFGFGGADAEEMLLITSVYLETHKPPKLAIISLDRAHLTTHKNLETRFYYLYYLNNKTINKKMEEIGLMTNFIKIAPFIKYSYFDEYNRTSMFLPSNLPKFDHNIYNGFLSNHKTINNTSLYNKNTTIDTLETSNKAIGNIKKMVVELQKAGCSIVMIFPPQKNSLNRNSKYQKTAFSILINIATE